MIPASSVAAPRSTPCSALSVAMISYAMNERRARKVHYLQEEIAVLKEALVTATGKKRIDFTGEQGGRHPKVRRLAGA